jgi:hypothetical protein
MRACAPVIRFDEAVIWVLLWAVSRGCSGAFEVLFRGRFEGRVEGEKRNDLPVWEVEERTRLNGRCATG